ncbi:MAG: hypothetical protein IJ946_02315 [Clostridia bacterium]|nr:hypothetical protein [Clostridia bacterium]
MLSLATSTHLLRRSFTERLHLCKNEKIIKESHTTAFGQICIYNIYYYSARPHFTTERLKNALKERIFTEKDEVPREYLKEAIILRLIEALKESRKKTVYLSKDFCDTPHLGQLCRYSAGVYMNCDILPDTAFEIYKSYGTLPFCVSAPVATDFCPDLREAFSVNLPHELDEIRPKGFSPTLFAGLIFKENGFLIK